MKELEWNTQENTISFFGKCFQLRHNHVLCGSERPCMMGALDFHVGQVYKGWMHSEVQVQNLIRVPWWSHPKLDFRSFTWGEEAKGYESLLRPRSIWPKWCGVVSNLSQTWWVSLGKANTLDEVVWFCMSMQIARGGVRKWESRVPFLKNLRKFASARKGVHVWPKNLWCGAVKPKLKFLSFRGGSQGQTMMHLHGTLLKQTHSDSVWLKPGVVFLTETSCRE